jgi:ribulose-phosphate 3-epimerase
MVEESGLPIEIEVDGGITDATIGGAAAAGADVFISGSWLYSLPAGKSAGVQLLREQAQAAMDRSLVAVDGRVA